MSRPFVCEKCGQVGVAAHPAGRLPTLCTECYRTRRRVPFRVGTCQACGEQFLPQGSTGPMPARCEPCQLKRRRRQTNAAAAKWRAAHPEANRAQQAQYAKEWMSKPRNRLAKNQYRVLREYGITPERLDQMFEEQGHRCAICHGEASGASGSGSRLHIDHCHETGRIRGLLCGSCNRGIGLLKDDPDRLRTAAAYIEASRQ